MRGVAAASTTLVFLGAILSGCISSTDDGVGGLSASEDEASASGNATAWRHSASGAVNQSFLSAADVGYNITQHYVGYNGPEPTLGVTSNGYIFFVALANILRSIDGGQTWQVMNDALAAPTTLDPMLWVDQSTDRVFANQLYLACSYMSFSDDYGETWLHNPVACGVPVNDHQKVTTGPYVDPAGGLNPVYPNVVYYAYNQIAGGRVAVSHDGGLTFPYTAATFRTDSGVGGLHGHITAGPDGTVYVPARNNGLGPIVTRSMDNGLTWNQVTVHNDIGTSRCDKNPELAVDNADNAYLVWPGADQRLYLSTSSDHGGTWGAALPAAPPSMLTTTMPVIVAGSPGRVAIAYYGSLDSLEVPDEVPTDTHWHLFVTYSLNALDDDPEFITVQVSPDSDPIQVGPISTNGCGAPGGSRNLLDFIDIVADSEGRPYVAFADGCIGCDLSDGTSSRAREGVVGVVQRAPSLFEEAMDITPLPSA